MVIKTSNSICLKRSLDFLHSLRAAARCLQVIVLHLCHEMLWPLGQIRVAHYKIGSHTVGARNDRATPATQLI